MIWLGTAMNQTKKILDQRLEDLAGLLARHRRLQPFLMGATLCALSVLCLRKVLWGNWTFHGDTSVWYALFEYFSNSIYFGSLALWNPYMNGGEPFWPIWSLWRLSEPGTTFFAFLAKTVHYDNIFVLHKTIFFSQCLAIIVGVAFLVRQLTKRNFPGLMSGLLFCLYFLSHYAVDIHVMAVYVWPYIVLFWLRFLEKRSSKDFLVFCFCLGLYIGSGSYPVIAGITLLFFVIPLTFLADTAEKRLEMRRIDFFLQKESLTKFALGLGLIVLLSGPFLVSALYLRDEVFPIARVAADRSAFEDPSRSVLDYGYLLGSGTSSTLKELLRSLASYPSAGMVLGLLSNSLVFCGLGFAFVRSAPFLLLLAVSVGLALGVNAPFHQTISAIFPPLFYVRNTFVFESFAAIFMAVIQGFGWKCFQDWLSPRWLFGCAAGIGLLSLIAALDFIEPKMARSYVTEAQYYADFDRHARPMTPLEPRIFAMKRTGWYVMEPLLYRTNTALQMIAVPPVGVKESELPYFRAWDTVPEEANRFPAVIGLRTIFWTKAYAEAYKAGETNLQEFLERLAVGRPYCEFSGGQVEALDPSPASMAFQVSAKEKGVLTVHDAPDPDWTAYVDGQKTPIRAQGLAKQVDVPEGRHTVSFVYRPKTFLFALALFWTTAVVVPLIGLVRLLNRHERLAEDAASHPGPSMKKSV